MISDSTNKKQALVAVIMIASLALIVVVLISGIGFSLGRIRSIFDALDLQTGIILGVTSVVALLCGWLIAATIRSTKQREIEGRAAAERANLYEAVLESLAARLSRSSDGWPVRQEAMLLKASVPVLKEYRLLLGILSDADSGEEQVREQANRLLLVMRRDCGLSTYGLESENWFVCLKQPMTVKTVQGTNNGTSAQRPDFASTVPVHRLSTHG